MEGGGRRSELRNLALLFAARAKDFGLEEEDVLWLAQCQCEHLAMVEALKKVEKEVVRMYWQEEL